MDIFSNDIEVEEIKIEDIIISNDKGLSIIKGENVGKRGPDHSEIVKEIAVIDALTSNENKAAEINGVKQESINGWKNGEHVDEETRARINQTKYNIADTATAKLMEALDLFDPNTIEKHTDIVRAAQGLATIVEKVNGNNKNSGNEIHLHMYAPKQKSIDKYKVIDV